MRTYAVRRLLPFLGVLQVIETEQARATSANGLVWHLELQSLQPMAWGSLNAGPGEAGWYLHALWSESEGLCEAPVGSAGKDRVARQRCEALIDVIRSTRLPLPLIDRRELWLLDEQQRQPLALLYAVPPETPKPSPEPRRWLACFGREGVAGQRRFPQTEMLESQVRRRAGFVRRRLWVEWDESRTEAIGEDGRVLPVAQFPSCGLREDWPAHEESERVAAYLRWIAPSLLTLPWLSDERRRWLEQSLSLQAVSIEYHWRLYPRILQPEQLRAARVQTRLQAPEHAINISRTESEE